MTPTQTEGAEVQKTGNAGVQGANNENGLAPLTTQERINLASGARNKIISTFSDALDFVRNALTNRQNVDRAYMGKVPDAVARRVLEDTGVDVTGYQVMVNGNDVRHIMKHHGDADAEALRGQLAVTESDIARISEIIAAPDSVALSPETDGKGRRALIFEKQIGDTLVAIEGVADGKHALETDTMRKRKSSRDTGRNAEANPSPAINAQSEPPQSSFNSEPTIPQPSNAVKSEEFSTSTDVNTVPTTRTVGSAA